MNNDMNYVRLSSEFLCMLVGYFHTLSNNISGLWWLDARICWLFNLFWGLFLYQLISVYKGCVLLAKAPFDEVPQPCEVLFAGHDISIVMIAIRYQENLLALGTGGWIVQWFGHCHGAQAISRTGDYENWPCDLGNLLYTIPVKL